MAAPKWHLKIEWREAGWYTDPELVVTVLPSDAAYAVAVELKFDEAGPFVTGVAVRRSPLQGWGGERTDVSPRDLQRLPLARIVRAALAAAGASDVAEARFPVDDVGKPIPQPAAGELGDAGWTVRPARTGSLGEMLVVDTDEAARDRKPRWFQDATRVLVPRGRPEHGKSAAFYKELANAYRQFAAQGLSPVKEIARRKRVPENTVHQWIHRARRLDFLEPSPRSRISKEEESDA